MRHPLADDCAEQVVIPQLAAGEDLQRGTQACFLVGFDAFANDAQVSPAIVEHTGKTQPHRDLLDLGQRSDACGQGLGVRDE
ncbi:hypothetical protein RZS08_34175, partial [Arthrospira platensis SPKY1]|nr:hypothetical protein [Arthrospira platensis SPKY1]